jgi:hypothetical protein
MLDIEDYDAFFDSNIYPPEMVHGIEANKKTLGGKTFFERLLELLQIRCTFCHDPRIARKAHMVFSRAENLPTIL